MIRLILCLLMVLGFSANAAPKDKLGLDAITKEMSKGLTVTVERQDCGMLNAFYVPSTKTVLLCNEWTKEHPEVTPFVLAHELAHAIIHQRDIPVTGSDEVAADELAALTLIAMGRHDDVFAAGKMHLERGWAENPFGPHPGDKRRGAYLMCLAQQSQGLTANICFGDFHVTKRTWGRLLK